MSARTVATTSSRALLAACERLGIDASELLRAAGLAASEVNDPDGRLPISAVSALWTAAFARSGDPEMGLRVALAVPFGAYRVIDFLAASAPTVGEGLVRVARYFPIINSAVAWEISERGETKELALTQPGVAATLPRAYAEFALAVTVLHCRHASGVAWPLVEVSFAHDAPAPSARYEEVFGCGVRFGARQSAFTLSRASWEEPSRSASSELLRTLEGHADALLAKLSENNAVSSRVARLIAEELCGGEPTLGRVATRMAMSARTLQRRLDSERTSFATVLDDTRRELSTIYMNEPNLALTEIAFLLGFADQSAFTRAFHRWHGTPPGRFRSASGGRAS